MKKILVLMMVVLLAVALVACGGDDTTTQKPQTTTAPKVDTTTAPKVDTTTAPKVDTTTAPGGDTTTAPGGEVNKPLFEDGVDIMNGDYENAAINPFWNQSMWPCAFEDHHAVLNFHWSLVFVMQETENGIYEQLIYTDPDAAPDAPAEQTGFINDEYKWVVSIDGTDYEITNFSFINNRTSGFIRMDLGENYKHPDEEVHDYNIVLKILNAEDNSLAFWAWFTDPNLCGPYTYEKPAPVIMVDDPNRPASHKAIPQDSLVAIAGPQGFVATELYGNLFDGQVRSKLCTEDIDTPIEFMIKDGAKTVVSYSIVGANDDEGVFAAGEPNRFLTNFVLYGSNDGQSWIEIDSRNIDPATFEIKNYGEKNYQLSSAVTYQYFKLEVDHPTSMFQCSEIVLYTED